MRTGARRCGAASVSWLLLLWRLLGLDFLHDFRQVGPDGAEVEGGLAIVVPYPTLRDQNYHMQGGEGGSKKPVRALCMVTFHHASLRGALSKPRPLDVVLYLRFRAAFTVPGYWSNALPLGPGSPVALRGI